MVGFQFVPLFASAETVSGDPPPAEAESPKENPPENTVDEPVETPKTIPKPEQTTESVKKEDAKPDAEETSPQQNIASADDTKTKDVVSTANVTGTDNQQGDGGTSADTGAHAPEGTEEVNNTDTPSGVGVTPADPGTAESAGTTPADTTDQTSGSSDTGSDSGTKGSDPIDTDHAPSADSDSDNTTQPESTPISSTVGDVIDASSFPVVDTSVANAPKENTPASSTTDVTGIVTTVSANTITGKNTVFSDVVPTGAEPSLMTDAVSGPVCTIQETSPPDTAVATPSTVVTGVASSTAGVVTDLNTNIVGNVTKDVTNLTGQTTGDVNLLTGFLGVAGTSCLAPDPSVGTCVAPPVTTDMTASVANTVTATADTGANIVTTDATGDASVLTGTAAALAAAVNLVNLNLVGSGSLLAVVNNFGEWTGDIIVPGEGLLSFGNGPSGLQVTMNGNQTNITDTVSATSDTGGNTLTGTGDIVTGTATATAGSNTIANTNFTGSAWFLFLLNNYGTWIGQVIDGDQIIGNSYQFAFGGSADGSCGAGCAGLASPSDTMSATISNNVVATANTGGNTVSGSGGNASISTGNATANAGVFNLVNTNVVGSNWLMGIFNNFGTWRGNLIFAYPDLTVAIDDGHDTATPGEDITYHVSITNKGLAKADGVKLSLDLPQGFSGASDTPSILRPGETYSFDVSGSVGDIPSGSVLVAKASAKTDTTEKHKENNDATDDTTVFIAQEPNMVPIASTDVAPTDTATSLLLKRSTESSSSIRNGESVTYEVVVKNNGKSPVSDVVVSDRIASPSGAELASFSWPIGTLDAGSGAIITYTISIPAGSDSGKYSAAARASGTSEQGDVRSKSVLAAFMVLGGEIASAAEVPNVSSDMPLSFETPSDPLPQVLGVVEESNRILPIWMLLFSGIAYYLFINWSFFPKTNYYGKS